MNDVEDRLRAALARPGHASSDFDLNPDVALPAGRKLRPAGVLVGVTSFEKVPTVILTKRSSALKHHPGQIAFPGGKQDETDRDVRAAALREAREEIGLPASHVDVLGDLPTHETVTGFSVTPVVAVIRDEFATQPEPGEVAEVFRVPLPHLLQPENYQIEARAWRGQQRRFFTVPFGPYYIWGATARMLRGLAARMEE
ncbi:CoA pyrophosphatase [Thalassococcus sp. S3]|uniref:CoA pyrophosphatase n=1 Tax=Thalassococcus sp. S3 TaxID=2017482 RepID=UPI0010243109|nr:CoA pyrophosphatase [Thalassococcus sp. S3]QBF34120.1 CoA pyrophosphatase [Thalassococcus sp. S3]